MKKWPLVSLDGLVQVSGGLGIPRPPETNPQPRQPENWDFWGPHLDRDQSYRPDRDGPANPEPPVYRYEPEQAPTWTEPPRGEERAAFNESSGGDYGGGESNEGLTMMAMNDSGEGSGGEGEPSPTYPEEPSGGGEESAFA